MRGCLTYKTKRAVIFCNVKVVRHPRFSIIVSFRPWYKSFPWTSNLKWNGDWGAIKWLTYRVEPKYAWEMYLYNALGNQLLPDLFSMTQYSAFANLRLQDTQFFSYQLVHFINEGVSKWTRYNLLSKCSNCEFWIFTHMQENPAPCRTLYQSIV